VEPPPLPDGVLIQSTYEDSEGREAGWRVWADGRHEGRRAGEDWQAGPPIDAAGLEEIARILDAEDLAAMEGEHRRDVETEHSSALWFQIAREGRPPVTVGLIDGARLDALDRLVARLGPVLSGGLVE
jgi:hypothetical protein